MIQQILKSLTLSLIFLVTCDVALYGQQSNQPALNVVWSSLIEHASINESEILSSVPHYPSADVDDNKLKNWIASYPSEVESFMGLFAKHDVIPSRIQLGIGVRKATYADVVPHWPNALSTYGSKTEILKQLPHMPKPEGYRAAEDYLTDQEKLSSNGLFYFVYARATIKSVADFAEAMEDL